MNRLILPHEANGFRPPVKSKVLAAEAGKRGIRLVNYDSLIEYLDNLPDSEGESLRPSG